MGCFTICMSSPTSTTAASSGRRCSLRRVRREHAALLIRSICLEQGRLSTQPLILHSDNGAVMKSAHMLATLADLGITASFSRPRVSNDNPYSESLFRTLKTRFDYPAEGFASLEAAQAYIAGFVRHYNHEHRHKGLNHVTPMQRRRGEDQAILQRRTQLHRQAREAHPERWHGREPRDWSLPERVRLGYGEEPQLLGPQATADVPEPCQRVAAVSVPGCPVGATGRIVASCV